MKHRRTWTKQDCETLKQLAGKMPRVELARMLGRTETATRIQASKVQVLLRPNESQGRLIDADTRAVEQVVAPAAIERALSIYRQFQDRDQSVMLQARKILTQHIFGMVDLGVRNEQRLTVGGLAHLKAVERDHAIKSARATPVSTKKQKASPVA